MDDSTPRFLEFFAGGGMARAGLEPGGWRCVFANEIDGRKAASYVANFGSADLVVGDVAALRADEVPAADLAWASFPCQDLSLAGARGGLGAARSGVFWAFWDLMRALDRAGRGPSLIVLENVTGLITSNGGADFAALCEALAGGGYDFGALVVDAARFTAQSRPRVFVIAARGGLERARAPDPAWTTPALEAAAARLEGRARARWRWLSPPPPESQPPRLADIVDYGANDANWLDARALQRLAEMMAPRHRAKLDALRAAPGRAVATVYKRVRDGVQRAEIRDDGLAGCLRTPAGGSSRQTLLIAEAGALRARLLTAREAARLMGLSEGYVLPARYNEAYRLCGDGVAVPVVAWLARHVLSPALGRRAARAA